MFKDYLQSIEGVEVYAIIAMLIFVSFFIAMIVWLLKVDKKYINKMKQLPLENDDDTSHPLSDEVHKNNLKLKN